MVVRLNEFYNDNKPVIQTSSTQQTNQVLNTNSVKLKLLIKDTMALTPQSLSSDLPIKRNYNGISDPSTRVCLTQNNSTLATQKHHSGILSSNNINSDSEHAMRVRLTQNKLTFAKRKSNQNFLQINCTNIDSTPASRARLTQNKLTPAQHCNSLKSNFPNQNIFDGDFDPRVRFTHYKLTLAGHNPILFNQSYISHNSNALFATHTSKHQIKAQLALNSTNTLNTPLQIEPQIALFETQNTGKGSLAYQNKHQFIELSHFNLSLTNKPQISSLISTQKSHTLNNARAQLTNNQKSLFAQAHSEIQLSSSSIILIENLTNSSKKRQQVSEMKGKSTSTRSTRTSPRVSFTDNATPNTPGQSPLHSNISTPLTESPQVLSSDKVIGKVFNKGLIASLTSKDAVVKELRDCIIRSDDDERLKEINPYLHSHWRDLHVSVG